MMIIVIKDNEIINVASPLPLNNPAEGMQSDGTYVLHLSDLEGLEPYQFIEQRYWNGNSLQTRPARPSLFYIWNGASWALDFTHYMTQVRFDRQVLLYKSDWTQLPDAPISPTQMQEALAYRQALRDMTDSMVETAGYLTIEDAPWPTPPTFLM